MHRFICLTTLATSLCLTQSSAIAYAEALTDFPPAQVAVSASITEPLEVPMGIEITRVGNAQWLLILGFLLTGGAITWGVYQYVQQQKWQHIEFLRQAVKEFEQDPEIYNALKILDFEEYRDYHIAQPVALSGSEQAFSFNVTDDLLCSALARHDQRARVKHQLDYHQDQDVLDPADLRRYQIETALRDWFNKMLNGLEHFGYFIESGLFTPKELEPWLNYWVKLIGDPVYRRPGSSRVYDALYSYIHHSGFFGVQKLFERFGYRILPSPYQDNDLIALNLAQKFDTRVALTLAKASYLAYQDKQFVAEVVERWGQTLSNHESLSAQKDKLANPKPVIDKVIASASKYVSRSSAKPRVRNKNSFVRHNFRYFNNRGRDTQAYLFRTEQFMVLAFRGSQEPKDWLTNVTTQLRNFTIRKDGVTALSSYKGRVHTGFFLAWASIERAVLAQMNRWEKDLEQSGKTLPPLYITGHSLGGALATMAAAALSDNGFDVAGVYTFGQPRVGDRTFVNQLNTHIQGKIFRFVNNNDIVPHVPPPFSVWNPTRFYGHIGTVKYFNAGGSIMANAKFASRLFDSTLGFVKGALGAGFDMITDHNMEYYISHLDKALKEESEDKAAHMLEIGTPDAVSAKT
ncbi:MAG: lipase family protein [Cyanobacteria bacterium J06598_1]